MAKVVAINTDAKGFVQSVKLLIGKTWHDGEQILECPIHKIVLLKESEMPNSKDAKCQNGLTSWGESVVVDTM